MHIHIVKHNFEYKLVGFSNVDFQEKLKIRDQQGGIMCLMFSVIQ